MIDVKIKIAEPEPAIDLTQIRFPSDRWSIANLRKLWPDSFDVLVEPESRKHTSDIHRQTDIEARLGGVIDTERIYAELVFRNYLGLPDNHRTTQTQSLEITGLIEEYIDYGLATGEHEAKEMIRDIETQAIAQAQRFRGK